MTFCWSYRPALIPPLKHLAAICHSSPGVGSQAAHSGTPGSPRRWRLRREQTLCASCLVRCCPSLQRARAFPPPPTPRPDFPPALTAPHVPSAEVLLSSEGGTLIWCTFLPPACAAPPASAATGGARSSIEAPA